MNEGRWNSYRIKVDRFLPDSLKSPSYGCASTLRLIHYHHPFIRSFSPEVRTDFILYFLLMGLSMCYASTLLFGDSLYPRNKVKCLRFISSSTCSTPCTWNDIDDVCSALTPFVFVSDLVWVSLFLSFLHLPISAITWNLIRIIYTLVSDYDLELAQGRTSVDPDQSTPRSALTFGELPEHSFDRYALLCATLSREINQSMPSSIGKIPSLLTRIILLIHHSAV
jgi:hypothetical protein